MEETTETTSISTHILEVAGMALSADADGQSVKSHSLTELIAADQYLAKKSVGRRRGGFWGACSIARAIPPGGIDET